MSIELKKQLEMRASDADNIFIISSDKFMLKQFLKSKTLKIY